MVIKQTSTAYCIDDRTGKVTIGHQVVQAESEIIATEIKGNSDSSPESKVTMPRKETTPHFQQSKRRANQCRGNTER